jgi:hypothetical protein
VKLVDLVLKFSCFVPYVVSDVGIGGTLFI